MTTIVEQETCPWCGGNNRSEIDEVSKRRNNYLKALEAAAGVADGFIEDVQTFRCTDCETIYLSSFFDKMTVGRAFTERTSGHNRGWSTFHSRSGMLPRKKIAHWRNKDRVKLDILKHVPPGDGLYVEVGCPFSGLLHEMVLGPGNEDIVASRYAGFLVRTMTQNTAAFSTFTEPRGGALALIGNAFRLAIKRKARRLSAMGRAVRSADNAGGKAVYLVKPDSRYIWNANCTGIFASCTATALAVYGVDRARLDELEELAAGRPITIGFFNTLDHLEEPRKLLERCMLIADTVIIETHGHQGGGGRQHLFFLNETISKWSAKKGWNCRDVSETLRGQYSDYQNFLFILSKATSGAA